MLLHLFWCLQGFSVHGHCECSFHAPFPEGGSCSLCTPVAYVSTSLSLLITALLCCSPRGSAGIYPLISTIIHFSAFKNTPTPANFTHIFLITCSVTALFSLFYPPASPDTLLNLPSCYIIFPPFPPLLFSSSRSLISSLDILCGTIGSKPLVGSILHFSALLRPPPPPIPPWSLFFRGFSPWRPLPWYS